MMLSNGIRGTSDSALIACLQAACLGHFKSERTGRTQLHCSFHTGDNEFAGSKSIKHQIAVTIWRDQFVTGFARQLCHRKPESQMELSTHRNCSISILLNLWQVKNEAKITSNHQGSSNYDNTWRSGSDPALSPDHNLFLLSHTQPPWSHSKL